MNLASEVWSWPDGVRIYSRLTTNVGRERLIARLRKLGLIGCVESIHAYFGDRAYGGSGYEVLWQAHVQMEDLQRLVAL